METANVIKFPKAKKRGRKVTSGPACQVREIVPSALVSHARAAASSSVDKLVLRLEEAFRDPNSELHSKLHASLRAEQRKERLRYEQWLNGGLISAREFSDGTLFGIATEHFGEGPDAFRWAAMDASGERLLKPWHRDRAFALAIECLNTVAHAVRYGALHEASGGTRSGYDREAADAYAVGVIATLGRTVALLRDFGAGAEPV